MIFNKEKPLILLSVCIAMLINSSASHAGLFDLIGKATDNSTQAAAAVIAAKYDPNGDLGVQSETLIRKINPERVKGAKKIAIGQFEVQFLERVEASATTSNVLRTDTQNRTLDDSVNAYVSLIMKGHERADFQKITDEIYTKLKTDLVVAGFELVPLESLVNPRDPNALTRFMDATSKVRPLELEGDGGKSVAYAPTDFPLHHTTEELLTGISNTQRSSLTRDPEDIYSPKVGLSSIGNGLPAVGHLSSLLYEFPQPINMLFVRYVVSPGSTKGETNKYGDGSLSDALKLTLTANASVTPHLVIAHNQTRFVLTSVNSTKGSRFSLISPVWSSESLGVVANTTDQGKKTMETVGNAAVSVLSILNRMGGGNVAAHTYSREEYTVITEPQAYNPQALKYLNSVQKMLIHAMTQATQ